MDVKIIRLPYREYNIGDVVDFGEAKNISLVSMQRAVWHDPDVEKKAKKASQEQKEQEQEIAIQSSKEEVGESEIKDKSVKLVETQKQTHSGETAKKPKKKLVENNLKRVISKKTSDKKSFWDKLK